MAFHVPERFRATAGPSATDAYHGNNGTFHIPLRDPATNKVHMTRVTASDHEGWEHVTVSFQTKTPGWEVMVTIKELFWGPEDCVMQFHPPQKEFAKWHPFYLHLWRPIGQEMPRPPHKLIGQLATRTPDPDLKES